MRVDLCIDVHAHVFQKWVIIAQTVERFSGQILQRLSYDGLPLPDYGLLFDQVLQVLDSLLTHALFESFMRYVVVQILL